MLFAMTLTVVIHVFVIKATLVLGIQEIVQMKMNAIWEHTTVIQRQTVQILTVVGHVTVFTLSSAMELFAKYQSWSQYLFKIFSTRKLLGKDHLLTHYRFLLSI